MNRRILILGVLLALRGLPLGAQSAAELEQKVDARSEALFGQDSLFHRVTPLPDRPVPAGSMERTPLSVEAGFVYVLLVVCGDECERNPPTISVPVGGDPDEQRGRQEADGVYRISDIEFDGTIDAEVRFPPCHEGGDCRYLLAVFRKKVSGQ